MWNEIVFWFSMGWVGGSLMGDWLVVGWGEGWWDIKKLIVVCQTWNLQQGSSVAHYSVVNLDKSIVFKDQLYHFMKTINLSSCSFNVPSCLFHSCCTAWARQPWIHVNEYMARAYCTPFISTYMAHTYRASFIIMYRPRAYRVSVISTTLHTF